MKTCLPLCEVSGGGVCIYIKANSFICNAMKNTAKRVVFVVCALCVIAVVLLAAFFLFSKSDKLDWRTNPLEQSKRLEVSVSKSEKKIAVMSPEDIIVAVNGYPLRKKDFDAWMAMLKRTVHSRMKNNFGEADQILDEMRVKFVDQFVSNRMLIDDARKYGVMSDEVLCEKMMQELSMIAEHEKTTVDGLMAKCGSYARYIAYQTAERILIKELVAQKIPPVTEVDMTFVSNTQAQVTFENNVASATNALRRQLIENLREEIISGKKTFQDQVERYKDDGRFEISDNGEWETVSRGDLNNPTLEEMVFSAKEGDVFPVREDEDGIDLICLNTITPPTRDKKGEIIEQETRELLRIHITKEPLFLRQTDEAMFKDLKSQMQLQAVDAYVDNLATNGSVKVVYPYGKHLF